MANIINIDDYRKRKVNSSTEKPTLREVIGPVEYWESEEEQLRYMMEKAKKDLEEWEKEKLQYSLK